MRSGRRRRGAGAPRRRHLVRQEAYHRLQGLAGPLQMGGVPAARRFDQAGGPGDAPLDGVQLTDGPVLVALALDQQDGGPDPVQLVLDVPVAERGESQTSAQEWKAVSGSSWNPARRPASGPSR